MLKTMTALSLGYLLTCAVEANAGDASRPLSHHFHWHRSFHHETVNLRASALVPASAAKSVSRPQPGGPEWRFLGGNAGYGWEPYGW